MIHLDTIQIPSGTQFACTACEGVLEAGTMVVRQWMEWSQAPGSAQQIALLHKQCAKDLGGDMVIEKGR